MTTQNEKWLSIYGKSGSVHRAIVAPIGIGLLTLSSVGSSALFHPGHIFDDFMHSGAIPCAIGVTLFLMIPMLSIERMVACKADGRSPWPFFWGMLGSLFILGMLPILFFEGHDYRLAVDLRHHGVPTRARVVREFVEVCAKNGCTTGLEYSFVLRGHTESAHGFVNEGYGRRGQNDEYNYAVSTRTLPIVYDPSNPNHSMVDWNNKVLRLSSFGFLLKAIAMFTGFLLFGLVAFGAMLLPVARAMSAPRDEHP